MDNITSKKWHHVHNIPWKVLSAFTLWQIGLTRNNTIFAREELYNKVPNKGMCKAMEYFAILAPIKFFQSFNIVGVRWHPPPQGWFKLNTNGSMLSNPGKAGAGVLIKDSKRDWVVGSYWHIPLATRVCAGLWALKDELHFVKYLNIRNIIIELDVIVVTTFIKNDIITNPPIIFTCSWMQDHYLPIWTP